MHFLSQRGGTDAEEAPVTEQARKGVLSRGWTDTINVKEGARASGCPPFVQGTGREYDQEADAPELLVRL